MKTTKEIKVYRDTITLLAQARKVFNKKHKVKVADDTLVFIALKQLIKQLKGEMFAGVIL